MPVFDAHMILTILGVAVVSGILGLDRTAAGQFMVSQPIVAGPVTGWLLGDATAGLVIGAALELIWLLDMPVGTFVPADATLGTVAATAIAVIGRTGGAPLPVIGFSMLLTGAIMPLTMQADNFIRKGNSKLAEHALSATGEGATHALTTAHLEGLVFFFLKSFLLCLVIVPLGMVAVSGFEQLPGAVHRALSLFVKLLPLLGAALVARKLSMRAFDHYLLAGFVIAAVTGQLMHVPSLIVMVLTVIAGWFGARYNEQRS